MRAGSASLSKYASIAKIAAMPVDTIAAPEAAKADVPAAPVVADAGPIAAISAFATFADVPTPARLVSSSAEEAATSVAAVCDAAPTSLNDLLAPGEYVPLSQLRKSLAVFFHVPKLSMTVKMPLLTSLSHDASLKPAIIRATPEIATPSAVTPGPPWSTQLTKSPMMGTIMERI